MTTEEQNSARADDRPPDEWRLSPELARALFRAVLVAIIAAAFVIPLGLIAVPYIEFFNDMAVQPRGNAQGLYGRTANQRLPVERLPVPGTIPRGYETYPFQAATKEAARTAGEKLVNPVRPTMADLERGRFVYKTYCYPCHGEHGDGDGPVVGPDRYPAPPSLTSETVKKYPDGQIFHIITKGVVDRMPGYEQQIPRPDRWKAVWFVRALGRATESEPQKGNQ
jgi:mono/diheme cytochrome c family protein